MKKHVVSLVYKEAYGVVRLGDKWYMLDPEEARWKLIEGGGLQSAILSDNEADWLPKGWKP